MGASRCASKRSSSLVDEDLYVGGEPNIDVVRQEACEVERVESWLERKQNEISEVLNRVLI